MMKWRMYYDIKSVQSKQLQQNFQITVDTCSQLSLILLVNSVRVFLLPLSGDFHSDFFFGGYNCKNKV